MDNLLTITGLRVDLHSIRGVVHAVRGVDLTVGPGEIHGIVGESGCGKSITAKSVLGLNDPKTTFYQGHILFDNCENLLEMKDDRMHHVRGRRISMIFQDPMASLNPLLSIGRQIEETIRAHFQLSKKDAQEKTISLLKTVGIEPAEKRYRQYPFELSGGLQQRVMIAIAISCSPQLLIADEPTTALDVTIQAQILELLQKLRSQLNMSIILISHDLEVIGEICDKVSVMYAGQIVETGTVGRIFTAPRHPYTRALLKSIPQPGEHGKRLVTIPGSPPDLAGNITGCAFALRCQFATDTCRKFPVDAVPTNAQGDFVRCILQAEGTCHE